MRLRMLMMWVSLLAPSLCLQAQGYHVTEHWKIGGEGGWDYLLNDPSAGRLYVTHGPRVEVLETRTGKPVGAITGLKSTHGVALDPDGKTGYVTDGGSNSVVIFDRKSLAVQATIAAGTNPDGIAYEPSTKTVWAFNGRSKDVSVIDVVQRKVIATISLPGRPEFPQPDGNGKVFVNIEDTNQIVVLDAREKKVLGSWALTGCESPSGMAIDVYQHRVFSVCDGGKMAVSDYVEKRVIAMASIGDSPDAVAFDQKRQLAFSSNGDGTLTVIDTAKAGYPVLQTVTTFKRARTLAYDEVSGKVFLSAARFGETPAPTTAVPHPRPAALPGSFEVLVVSR